MECLHFGTPPPNYECWESKTFPLGIGNDNYVELPEFKCFGHTWRLEVWPGGFDIGKKGYVTVFMSNPSREKISLHCDIALLDVDDRECRRISLGELGAFYPIAGQGNNLVKRATLIENQSKFLANKAFKIKVQMRIGEGYHHNSIYQSLPVDSNVDIFQDNKTSDIAFDSEGGPLLAHKCIIKSKAQDFYVMCEGYNLTSPMPITDADKDIFEIMLCSLYGGDVLPGEWQKHSEAILKAAGKYGFSTLKREAEVWYLKSVNLTVENVIDAFMKADGNNHVGVKAAAKKFIIDHGEEVVASESFDNLYESKELVTEVAAHLYE